MRCGDVGCHGRWVLRFPVRGYGAPMSLGTMIVGVVVKQGSTAVGCQDYGVW